MTLILLLAAWLGADVGLALWVAAWIHRGNPLPEKPIRVVKVRGELVDLRA